MHSFYYDKRILVLFLHFLIGLLNVKMLLLNANQTSNNFFLRI